MLAVFRGGAADEVADDMFRKVVDRFADDGVITEKERANSIFWPRPLS